jgi:signal transduction histidine kinase
MTTPKLKAGSELGGLEPLIDTILTGIGDGVLIYDADGRILHANAQAAAFLASPADSLTGSRAEDIRLRFEVLDEGGRPLPSDMSPSRRVLRGEPAVEAVLRLRRPDEEDRWVRVKSLPVSVKDGTISMVVSIIHDLGQERISRNADFMTRAGTILSSSLNYESTLAGLAQLTVPEIADWCAIDILEDGEIKRVAVVHSDPKKVDFARTLQTKVPASAMEEQRQRLTSPNPTGRLIDNVTDAMIDASVPDEKLAATVKDLGLKSAIIVPLQARGRALGELTVAYAESNRRYSARDLQLLEGLGRRAGLALDNARLYRESQLGRAELEKANKAKDEFIGFVAHELRTPITTIFGSARLLNRPNSRFSDEERGELIQSIADESTRMASLVENLLLLSRLEVGAAVEKSPVAVAPVVERAVSSLKAASPKRVVNISMDTAPAMVIAQETYLEQILQNLLSNANKFSPIDQPIDVLVEQEGSEISFKVLDRGPGVDPDEITRLFDSFYRSPSSAGLPGKGLGLAVCKRLAEALGGRIWAALRPGGGLEVTFALPAGDDERPEKRPR